MPIRITVAQHIYGSLTTEQSPTRRRGYQTLFYTRGQLTAAAVRVIEDRSQYRSTQGGRDKWQFFGLPGGQAVISHLVTVPELDEFGRKGRYLAHSFIVGPADWQSLNYTPFGLMKATTFCETMDRALSLGSLATGEAGAVTLELSQSPSNRVLEFSQQWTTEELWKLAQLTCHTQSISQRGHFVSFIGDERQIQEALEVALLFAPPPRLVCTFDTSSGGCSWPREVNFWGQGFAEEREARSPFVVNASQRKVRVPGDWRPPETPYEQWVKTQLRTRQIATIQKHQQGAYVLSAALSKQVEERKQASPIEDAVKNDFANANRAELTERIACLLPKEFPRFLVDMILDRIGRTPQAKLDWLVKNPAGEGLADILFQILRNWEDGPAREIQQSMKPWIDKHTGLRLLFTLWSQDQRAIQAILSVMTAEEYRLYVQNLCSQLSCARSYFFCAKHLNEWFMIFGSSILIRDVAEGISIVAAYGSQRELDLLSVIPEKIRSVEGRDYLLTWLNKQSFRKRLKALISVLEESLRTKSKNSSNRSSSWLRRITKRS